MNEPGKFRVIMGRPVAPCRGLMPSVVSNGWLRLGRVFFSLIGAVWKWGWLMALLGARSWAEVGFPAGSLHITVVIDGSDELHISHRAATWVHKTWGQPTEVVINGCKWNPQQRPVLIATNSALLVPGLDLCGAVLHKLRGRGSVELGREAAGLVIRFDDPENGADTYEVELDFAQWLAQNKKPQAANDLELRLAATIDGTDEIWFSQNQGKWVHTGAQPPTDVTVNGHPWNVAKFPVLTLEPALLPEVMDMQRATLTRVRGRGASNLELYQPEVLCLDFEDPEAGADRYEVVVHVPRFGVRHLVRLTADAPDVLQGAPLRICRFPAAAEADALLPGQRLFDARGQCLVALPAGEYRFEVLHQAGPQLLAALGTGVVNIAGPTNVELRVRRAEPRLYGPDRQPLPVEDLLIRSTRPCGGLSWKASDGPNSTSPTLLLSDNQSYGVHAFAHAGSNYVALWRTATSAEFTNLTLRSDQWLTCSFAWEEGTPAANSKGVVLQFPDGQIEILRPESARLFTNRRFFNVNYWLGFADERKAVFEPQGHVLSANGGEVLLGGALRPLASAMILQDENLGRPEAVHLWWEITLADSQHYLLDTAASKVAWAPALTTLDGRPALTAPLLPQDVQRLGNLKDTLVASVRYNLERAQEVALHPEPFASRESARCFTQVPPYREWNTRAYLAKAERELKLIALARAQPLAPTQRFEIKWWFNSGAIGANNSVTMPIPTYLGCRDWYAHPWAIAHEMLHSFGYGHTHEMDRLDREVQGRMAQFQWYAADHPEYVPGEKDEPVRP